jgi:hypothetical protein
MLKRSFTDEDPLDATACRGLAAARCAHPATDTPEHRGDGEKSH